MLSKIVISRKKSTKKSTSGFKKCLFKRRFEILCFPSPAPFRGKSTDDSSSVFLWFFIGLTLQKAFIHAVFSDSLFWSLCGFSLAFHRFQKSTKIHQIHQFSTKIHQRFSRKKKDPERIRIYFSITAFCSSFRTFFRSSMPLPSII